MVNFLWLHWTELGQKIWQQFILVSISTAMAIFIGVTTGVLCFKHIKLSRFLINIAGVIQTIPSLALLTFLLPLFGIGTKPALVALSLYALLPILSNTLVGLQKVPNELLETTITLGFTRWQRLIWLEIPMASPVIFTGIRTAVIINVGVATLAAFIGAGGLGDFINRGLASNNTSLILLGAIPAAIMAMSFDIILGFLVNISTALTTQPKKYYRKLGLIFFGLLMLVLCLWQWSKAANNASSQNSKVVRVASKNFTESILLGEIVAQTIEHNTSLRVERYFNLGSTEICQQALIQKKIDLYPEYTGTAYLVVLHGKHNLTSTELLTYLSNTYAKRFHLQWLVLFGFNNTEAIAVRNDFAQKNHIKTISELLPFEKQLIAGVPSEFIDRPDGIKGLAQLYHLIFSQIKEMSPALMYEAIAHKNVNVISAFSTDARIQENHLTLLEDDKHLFPPYDAAIIARDEILSEHPELKKSLLLLSGLVDNQTMQDLNRQVEILQLSPSEVATKFLMRHGVI